MKKGICVLLVLLEILMLTACTAQTPQESLIPVSAQETPAAEEDEAEESAEENQEGTFSRGNWEKGVYRNEFADLMITLPAKGWTIAQEEELADQSEVEDAAQLEKEAEKLENACDLNITNEETGANAVLFFQNLETLKKKKATAKDYAEELVSQLDASEDVSFVTGEIGEESIGAESYVCVATQVEDTEIAQEYLIRREGNHMIVLILTGTEEEIRSMLKMMSGLEKQE